MKKVLIFIICIISTTFLQAQNLDSLWNIWQNQQLDDTARLEAIEELAMPGMVFSNPDSALKLAKLQYAFAGKIANKRFMASALNIQGVAFAMQSNYPKSIDRFLLVKAIHEETGNKKGMAMVLNNLGRVYDGNHEYSKSFDIYKECITILDELDNEKGMIMPLINLGFNYANRGAIEEALESLKRAYDIAVKYDNNRGIFDALAGIGYCYELNNDLENALDYNLKSLNLSKQIGPELSIVQMLNSVGKLYQRLGVSQKAIEYCKEGNTRAFEASSILSQKNSCDCLYNAYKDLGDHKNALGYHEQLLTLKDSIFNQENTKELTRLEMNYEFEKQKAEETANQDKKDALAAASLNREKLIRNGFIVGFIIVLLFALIFFGQRNKIAQQKEKAEQSEAFKQQFLANMSHEIRTPMNAVMGMTNLVLDTKLEERQKFYLEGIQKSAINLLYIINDILDLSKIEAGKMELEEVDFSISDVIDQVKQTIQHKADEKGLELIIEISKEANKVVVGDPVRLNQVLINLTNNAIKFTEKGSVIISVESIHNGIQFSIVDTGIGIPQEKLQSIFENFTQANASDSRKYGGTGLGLSISRQLVELMGSSITIESTVGSGTTFSFVVDFKKGSTKKLEERLAIEKSVDGSILNGLKILIADDNEYNRIVAKDTLMSKAKLEIHEAENGQEAANLLSKMHFDLILMDVQMPVMNGYQATQLIRSMDKPMKSTPIIALTASVLRSDLDKCKEAGMNTYIPKPFKPQDLILGIAQTLGITLKLKKEVDTENSPIEIEEVNALEVSNLAYLNEFCEGDQEKMKKYIAIFLKSAPLLTSLLKKAMKEEDMDTIANQVHGFKTKLIMMGMAETKEISIQLEKLCREDPQNNEIPKMMDELIKNINTALLELNEAVV